MIFCYKSSFGKGKILWFLLFKYGYFPFLAYPSTELLLKLPENVLKLNKFMFSCENYIHMWQWKWNSHRHQNSSILRQYIYGKIERNLLLRAPCKCLSWLRFIDDIEMKWVEKPDCPNDFTTFANSFNNSITFTQDIYRSKKGSLNTTSTLKDGKITFSLNTKPTNSHLFIKLSSCHIPIL